MNRILCSTGAIIGKANNNDYTVESTALAKNKEVDFAMLNRCFDKIREII